MPSWGAYVFDKDGTLVNGAHPIPGAAAFVRELQRSGTPYLILSNTGEKDAQQVADSLGGALGVPLAARHVYTAREHMAAWLARQTSRSVLTVGAPCAPWASFEPAAAIPRDCRGHVIALFSDGALLDYLEHVTAMGEWVRRGAMLCASSMDDTLAVVHPGGGMVRRPGPGLLVSAVMALAGKPVSECRAFGKGCDASIGPVAMRRLRSLGYEGPAWRVRMVGDRLDTDVELASASGWSACLVESGCHTIDDHRTRHAAVHTVAASVRELLGQPRMHAMDVVRVVVGKASSSMPARRILSCPARLDEAAL